MSANVVFVLGLPGAGKGTQCSKLVEKYGCLHISAGDLLRKVRDDKASPFSAEVQHCLKDGKLVPTEMIVGILRREIERYCSFLSSLRGEDDVEKQPSYLVLIDGFPRSLENFKGWEQLMKGKAELRAVLLFEGPAEMFTERCLKRTGRIEDTRETLEKRVDNFWSQSAAVAEHFETQGLLHRIDTSSTDVQKVFESVEATLLSLDLLPRKP